MAPPATLTVDRRPPGVGDAPSDDLGSRPLVLFAAVRAVVDARRAVPAEDLAKARICVLHFLTCAVRGRDLPWCRSVLALADDEPVPDSPVWAFGAATPVRPETAVFANAVLGQSTLAEDVHPPSLVHPGSIVVPAALAVAAEVDATGADFLAAVVAGYRVACGLGAALKTNAFVTRGFRPSGVFGPFGAAAAAAYLRGLDESHVTNALGIAGNTSAGLREWALVGSTDIYLQNGFAARNGYQAARLAAAGFQGPATILEGEAGIGVAFAGGEVDWAVALDTMGRGSVMREIEFKRFAACSAVQTVLELAWQLHTEHHIDPANIEAVEIRTHRHGKHNPGCDSTGPWSGVGQAQMSNQLGVALALHGIKPDLAGYLGYGSTGAVALAQLVTVVEDPELTARYPERSGARITLRLRDGGVVEGSLGHASPLTDVDVDAELAIALGNARADCAAELTAALRGLETVTSMRTLVARLGVYLARA